MYKLDLTKRLNARKIKTFPTVSEMVAISQEMSDDGLSNFILYQIEDYVEARVGTSLKHNGNSKYIEVVYDFDVYLGSDEEELLASMNALEEEAKIILNILN